MDSQLQKAIQLYLNGDSTLKGLEERIVSNLQRILDSNDNQSIGAVNQIDADLIRFGEGLINEVTIRENIQRIDREVSTISNQYVVFATTGHVNPYCYTSTDDTTHTHYPSEAVLAF